eukprot:TRINITY_DN74216_c0_g1_i1.p1 TRINITY_DN74216_c0_g1~~TRINITY_DN74216_c0_g1_i1.p1  ORF type:complete len:113 (-),score=39.41 TRINITY_DN74216_c0_g1_i1:156-494(-)
MRLQKATGFALAALAAVAAPFAAANAPLDQKLLDIQLSTPKPVTEAQMLEFKQDFADVDFNKDDVMDAQEVRAHFKGGISDIELYQFFLDSDKDKSGSISLQEYVDYAAMLN